MAAINDFLRQIPSVDELLSHPTLAGEQGPPATEAVRLILDELRGAIRGGACSDPPDRDRLAARALARLRLAARPSLRRVVNATGIVLHTNLGRAPLPPSVAAAVRDVAGGYSTLEYDPDTGGRGSRYDHVRSLLTRLTGAEDALVVNNNAAAVLLALSTLKSGGEVIVSRGELVEIGGKFRIPDVMAQSGCVLREVGSTNRTRMADYKAAIGLETVALFKAHPSNFRIVGFFEEATLPELVELGRRNGLPVFHDLGSGAMLRADLLGVADEPCVADSVAAGADVVCFSGDKLLGGPQAGILVGTREWIGRMKQHPLTRALRIDKLTLAALEATLRLYLDPARAMAEVPVLAMLRATEQELRSRAEELAGRLAPLRDQVAVVEVDGEVGGGSAPTQTIPSTAVAVTPRRLSVSRLEQSLRLRDIPIVARISHDRLLLDVRTIQQADLDYVANTILELLGEETP